MGVKINLCSKDRSSGKGDFYLVEEAAGGGRRRSGAEGSAAGMPWLKTCELEQKERRFVALDRISATSCRISVGKGVSEFGPTSRSNEPGTFSPSLFSPATEVVAFLRETEDTV